MAAGKVYLVGAGPGNEGLLTVRGAECIRQADVIFYDRLVNPLLLEQAPIEAERIYCGKLPQKHILRQEVIQKMMVEKSREGKRVVRLKGGDPGVFGRVGEEAAVMEENGIEYEIVPGITSGIAAPLYAGVPVTHRDYSGSFAAITAHTKKETGEPDLDWEPLAKSIDTVAFYMGVKNLPFITKRLIEAGKPKGTAVMVVEWGTYSKQRTVKGTLADINDIVQKHAIENPSITLVGNVVKAGPSSTWFEELPLFGRYIWHVRTTPGAGRWSSEWKSQGAEVYEGPVWEETMPELVHLQKDLPYDEIVFETASDVEAFVSQLKNWRLDLRQVNCLLTAATRRAEEKWKEYGVLPEFRSKERWGDAEGVHIIGSEEWIKEIGPQASSDIGHVLKSAASSDHTLERLLVDDSINTVIFPCRKAVTTAVGKINDLYNGDAGRWWSQKTVVCIGERTKEQAEKYGIRVDTTAEASAQAVTASIQKCLSPIL
ncbi:uroporphyrinogen-III C-methyltransferase [Marinococcus luteus]|uniref:uroporphyrinogen-III C-methyltransferase n=1 Tax=Marinococcus luteus TaxID=1122204 RepID=UPI002ACCFEF2|nr:uroporphyrinogen-III C-methyltransferase [Marinococcus luteus]MDZ5783187.1 uroporphyrinogen-III C-methyltransferase [Marinococcus luteus]